MQKITIIKQDYKGQEIYRYQGEIIKSEPDKIVVSAIFKRLDTPVDDLILKSGDLFVETYFKDRWYNIYEVHVGDDDLIKGWYCNIGYPATIQFNSVSYRDLAIDLLVYPDGRQIILDMEEFYTLPISPQDQAAALNALSELQRRFTDLT